MRHTAGGRSFTARQGFSLPVAANSYASERITAGIDSAGRMTGESFSEVSVLVEGSGDGPVSPVAISVELWVPSAAASDGGPLADSDFTLAGSGFAAITAAGLTRFAVGRLPGFQVRVKPTAVTPGGITQYVSVWAG